MSPRQGIGAPGLRALIGLEHAVGESVLGGEIKVGLTAPVKYPRSDTRDLRDSTTLAEVHRYLLGISSFCR